MEKILFIAHTALDGTLPKAAREALNAAVSLVKSIKGATLSVGLVGKDVQKAADSMAACDAAQFLSVAGADFALSRYASDAAAFEALARKAGASIIIAPATSRTSRALPGLACRLEGRIDTHICGLETVDGTIRVQRWYYRQRMLATLTRSIRPWIMLLDPGIWPPFEAEPAPVRLEPLSLQLSDNCKRTSVTGTQAASGTAQTIRPDAKLLFVAGAGWTKKQADGQTHVKEAEALILDFINQAQASLGSSKSLVDQSGEGQEVLPFLSHMNQVGQTGSTPRHPKGLATCCHGEEPHVVGWRFISERRAINLDPNCGWAQGKADVLYVADAFKVMSRVNELLKQRPAP